MVQQDISAAAHIIREFHIRTVGVSARDQVVREGLPRRSGPLDHDGIIGRFHQIELLQMSGQQLIKRKETVRVHVREIFQRHRPDEVVAVRPDDRVGQRGLFRPLFPLIPIETAVESAVRVFHRSPGDRPFVDVHGGGSRLQDQMDPLLPVAHIGKERLLDASAEGERAVPDRRFRQCVLGVLVDQPDGRSVIGRKDAVNPVLTGRAGCQQGE